MYSDFPVWCLQYKSLCNTNFTVNLTPFRNMNLIKLLKYTSCKQGFAEDCQEGYENRTDHLNNNLRLKEISIFIFFQFCCKIIRNQLEIVVEATYGLIPY